MTFVRTAIQRTCFAFAFRASCRPHSLSGARWISAGDNFVPPPPPTSKGMPVFPDIDFSHACTSEAVKRNADPDAVFVVNGSSRGIGLQFIKSLVARTKGSIVACCRNPDGANGLNEFISSLSPLDQTRIQRIPLDLENQLTIEHAGETIRQTFGRVDVLLNVAGILGDGVTTSGPERSILKLDRRWIETTMAVNVIGPVMLIKELVPIMKTKRTKDRRPTSVVANLSARVGSIADNELGGWYSYRFSKAALNQATRTMAHELKRQGTWSLTLHPGTTNTDLSQPFQKNVAEGRLFPVDFTAKQLLDVIDSMQEEHSGGLYDWSGKALPF